MSWSPKISGRFGILIYVFAESKRAVKRFKQAHRVDVLRRGKFHAGHRDDAVIFRRFKECGAVRRAVVVGKRHNIYPGE